MTTQNTKPRSTAKEMQAAQAHKVVVAHLPYMCVKHTPDSDTRSCLQHLGNAFVNPLKADAKSRREHGIPEQHLLQAHLILEPHTRKTVHTFLG